MTPTGADLVGPSTTEYSKLVGRYEDFAVEVKRTLEATLAATGLKCQAIESRAKSVESFGVKSMKKDNNGVPKYSNPLLEITDLAGARIITYTLGDVQKVCGHLENYFDVREKMDVGEDRYDSGRFGYQSIHYLCRLSSQRLELPDFMRFRGLVCEIQVRTVLQHVWAQIEHGMQYKATGSLPRSIKRKFTSLAGLLEIGDREFQAIESEYEGLKDAVRSDFEDALTKEAFGKKENAVDGASPALSDTGQQEVLGVRDLVAQGRYSDAIQVYDAKIAYEPKNVTLFLGRAKAKFLIGNIAGAESDIKHAESLQPGNLSIASLRERIVEGTTSADPGILNLSKANELTTQGRDALRNGDGELAYLKYSEALESGASRPFSTFNRAMACVLAEDLVGASNFLTGLEQRPGTPMEINILALKAILEQLVGDPAITTTIDVLKEAVALKGDYSYQLSPLIHLQCGLLKKGTLYYDKSLGVVFDVLVPQN